MTALGSCDAGIDRGRAVFDEGIVSKALGDASAERLLVRTIRSIGRAFVVQPRRRAFIGVRVEGEKDP